VKVATIIVPDGNNTTNGTEGPDVIDATSLGNHIIKPRGGDDCILTGTGNNRVDSSPGADEARAVAGANNFNGGEDDDILLGGSGNDTKLAGGAGVDFLMGNAGNDKLYGGNNDDGLLGGDGNDCLDGGTDDFATTGVGDICIGGAGANCCRNCELPGSCDPPGAGVCVGSVLKACGF
jgi:Ca2+-binding RTX toxin-like protein